MKFIYSKISDGKSVWQNASSNHCWQFEMLCDSIYQIPTFACVCWLYIGSEQSVFRHLRPNKNRHSC